MVFLLSWVLNKRVNSSKEKTRKNTVAIRHYTSRTPMQTYDFTYKNSTHNSGTKWMLKRNEMRLLITWLDSQQPPRLHYTPQIWKVPQLTPLWSKITNEKFLICPGVTKKAWPCIFFFLNESCFHKNNDVQEKKKERNLQEPIHRNWSLQIPYNFCNSFHLTHCKGIRKGFKELLGETSPILHICSI